MKKGEDDLPKIVGKEVKAVCLIYKLFLEGKTTSGIAVSAEFKSPKADGIACPKVVGYNDHGHF